MPIDPLTAWHADHTHHDLLLGRQATPELSTDVLVAHVLDAKRTRPGRLARTWAACRHHAAATLSQLRPAAPDTVVSVTVGSNLGDPLIGGGRRSMSGSG